MFSHFVGRNNSLRWKLNFYYLFWSGFGQRLPHFGRASEEDCKGEAAVWEVGHEEVGLARDVWVQPIQDQDSQREGKNL